MPIGFMVNVNSFQSQHQKSLPELVGLVLELVLAVEDVGDVGLLGDGVVLDDRTASFSSS